MKMKEIRSMAGTIEFRDDTENDDRFIEGYALKFDTWSGNLGKFKETIQRGALDNTDFSDVRALFNHNADHVLARSSAGTLKLDVDDVGLKFRAKIPNTSYGNDLIENIRNGNINQCSFGFKVAKDGDGFKFDHEENIYRRSIRNIEEVADVSVVTYPAYEDTEVAPALRSIDKIEEKQEKIEQRAKDKEKLKVELELL